MRGVNLEILDPSGPMDSASTLHVTDPRTGAVLVYEAEDGSEQPVSIFLLGSESRVARAKKRAIQDRRLSKVEKGKKIKLSAEGMENEQVEVFAALTTGWAGIEWRGELLEFSPHNARMLYLALPFLVEQISAHVADLDNYVGKSAADSAPSPDTSGTSASE